MIKIENKYLLSKNIDKIIGKRVLARVDLNTETHELTRTKHEFTQTKNYRIKVVKDLLKLLEPAKQIILISHFDNPLTNFPRALVGGGFDLVSAFDEAKPLRQEDARAAESSDSRRARKICQWINKYSLKKFVKFLPDVKFFHWKPSKKLPNDKYILLENLRFFEEEKKNYAENDKLFSASKTNFQHLDFAKNLSELADVFINEAFSVSHRKHASVIGIPKFLPSYFGINFEREIKNLNKVFEQKNGLAVVIGGAKIETKLPLLKKFLDKADLIVLGGLIAKQFVGAQQIASNKILTPIKPVMNDTDLKSIKLFLEKLKNMELIVWNGVFGKVENKKFTKGTLLFAKELAKIGEMNLKNSFRPEIKTKSIFHKNFTIVGGGDTISFLYKHNLQHKFDFVSTGGGAMLDYLANETLPGIEAIQR